MNALDTDIRNHFDTIAAPVTLDEVQHRADATGSRTLQRRWPVAAAAATVAAVGVAALAVSLSERDPAPATEASTTASVTPSTSPATILVPSFDVDVPPGLTVEEVGELLGTSSDTLDPDQFVRAATEAAADSGLAPDGVSTAEGLLAPGPYTFAETSSESDIAVQMIAEMNDLTRAANIESGRAVLGRTAYEIVIIASMIELEADVEDDFSGISRVIHNRLAVSTSNPAEPLPLQIDSAVLYGAEQLNISDTPFAELRSIPSDWNTYMLPGLPRTPISNPSAQAITAALHPRPNPPPNDPSCVDLTTPGECLLLFYVVGDEDGSMNFATTPEQHLANVERARELGMHLDD